MDFHTSRGKRVVRGLLAIAALAGPLLPAPARAQVQHGFALDRYNPSERGSDWFVLESLDFRGNVRPAIGIVGDYGYKPLVAYDNNGNEVASIIRHQLFGHVGASLVLWERLRLAFNLPILLYQKGTSGFYPGGISFQASNAQALGDLRLTADVRLFGSYQGPASLALGAQVFVPTGSQKDFTSDGKVRVEPRLMFAGDASVIAYAAKVGITYRAQDAQFAGTDFGSEFAWSAALGLHVADRKLLIGPEIYGASTLSDPFKKRTAPTELVVGAHYVIGNSVRVGAGVGPGITRGFGTPELRALASFEWMSPYEEAKPPPPPPPPDRDGDGIYDRDDACPDEKGVANDDPKKNGCPPPKDTDGDGIIDPEDACPETPGPRNEDPKKNGCPAARIEKGQIRILEQVKFATASDRILPESDGILSSVAKILDEHPEITKISIEGHTDNRGSAPYNKKLSQRRAASVAKWLVKRGISTLRITSQGYGMERPIDSNDTDEGRAANRRVEFHIVEIDGKPAPSAGQE